jgi:alkylation response protein AidB-like acyl-CoA dehydrogenase
MSAYKPPVEDMLFVLNRVIGIGRLPQAQSGELDEATMEAILGEAAKLAAHRIAPLNAAGDHEGCRLEGDAVKTAPGFKEAYAEYRDNGWNGVPFAADYGGMGLPLAFAYPVQEMWQSASMAFGLCPMLNQAAVEATHLYGTEEQKALYLPKLVSGEWTGTMNLTEPQAGTDLAAVKTQAKKQEDGSYLLTGQKIFITYGDHDMAPNIVHMVLARTPGAPEGIKGISMFLVPKFIPDAAGDPGERNDLACIKLEEKLGIHASPTCVMQYGDRGGARGWLIGRENEGIKYMFTMMNNARLAVGLQGVAEAERAYQHALAYARERVQGFRLGEKGGARVAIIEHEDVRRMLLSMKAQVEAARALAYEAALQIDLVKTGDAAAQAKVDLLTPVVKAWCTDVAVEVASTALQVHGGMGFIEETGAAQFYRDARILPIYEGTNGVQAADLVFRKVLLNGGAAARAWFEEARQHAAGEQDLLAAIARLEEATQHLLATGGEDPQGAASVSVPYLQAFGVIAGGVMMARALASLEGADAHFAEAKRGTARFYMSHILPRHLGCLATVRAGAEAVKAFPATLFAA